MTVKNVTIPTIKAFCNLDPKAQALKPLEEAAEVFGAWQKYNSCTDMCRVCEHTDESRAAYDGPANRYPAPCPSREALMDEIADCIQSCANLAAMLGMSDLTPYMERCEERNRERGRYGD